MKKAILISLLAACLLFAGCGENQDPYETDLEQTGETTVSSDSSEEIDIPLTIGYSPAAAAQSGRLCPDGNGGLFYRDAATGSLCHAKLDGSDKTVLSEVKPLFLNVVNDTLFFLDDGADNALCSMPAGGGEVKILSQNNNKTLFAIGDTLYYSDAYALYTMKQDGSDNKKLMDNAAPVGYRDGMLYYTDGNRHLYRYSLVDKETTPLIAEPVTTVTVNENGIFYNSEMTGFTWLKEDGSAVPLITGMNLHMVDGKTLYFKAAVNGVYYQMDIEATAEAKPLAAFSRLYFTSDGIPKQASEIDLANASAIYSEDGSYLYAIDGQVYVYATLGESMKSTEKAECMTIWNGSEFVIW